MIGSDCANVVNLPLFQQHLQVNTGELVVEVQLVGGVVWNDAWKGKHYVTTSAYVRLPFARRDTPSVHLKVVDHATAISKNKNFISPSI